MEIFQAIQESDHEQVVFCSEPASRLRGIIAIHDTTLGPAIGGVRMWPYASEEEALNDVLRLSKAITYKAAAAGVDLGGGQAVIIGDPELDKTEFLLKSFGRFVESLGGRFIAAEDVGTTIDDMEIVRSETEYVVGLSRALGGGGDPGEVTAIGVVYGMISCVKRILGRETLEGLSISVQGLGGVGYPLARELHRRGCNLIVADLDERRVKKAVQEFDAQPVGAEEIYAAKADIFSPNALGGIINPKTVGQLRVKIIAGGANNQLAGEELGHLLHNKGIFYAPDYVIGAGGLINVTNELLGYDRERALAQAVNIGQALERIIQVSERENILPLEAANQIAEHRLDRAKRSKQSQRLC